MRSLPAAIAQKVMGAAALFAEHGLDATKMDDVAAATGVPKATLYYYFEGKEDILRFLFSEILHEVGRAIAAAVAAEGDASERLAGAIEAHLEVFERFPMESRALQFDLGRAARMPEIAERVNAAFLEPVHGLLLEGAADGSLRHFEDSRLVATAILGAITTTGLNALTIGHHRASHKVTAGLVDLVLSGVAS
jgi:TetR/AcrR family transcriptional regulator